MPHVIERAASGRAKCRGCGERIAADEQRFGEHLPIPFAEGDMVRWFHLECAAYKRPEPFLETLKAAAEPPPDATRLEAEATRGTVLQRLQRIDGAGRAPSGRAQCRSCREPIAKGAWRIALVYYDNDRFEPSGFVHVRCAPAYFETGDFLARVERFSHGLGEEERGELRRELEAATSSPEPSRPPQ